MARKDIFDLGRRLSAAGDISEARRLIALGADVNFNRDGGTQPPLFASISRQDESMTRFLLENGADPNLVSNASETGDMPLHFAAAYGDLAGARLLLDAGAEVDARNAASQTAFLKAVAGGDESVAELLLDNGAEIEACNAEGRTPLHVASQMGWSDMVVFLLEKGADIHAQDGNGETPLHLAAAERDIDVMKLLVAAGADIHRTDRDGATPIGHYPPLEEIAAEVRKGNLGDFLAEHRARMQAMAPKPGPRL